MSGKPKEDEGLLWAGTDAKPARPTIRPSATRSRHVPSTTTSSTAHVAPNTAMGTSSSAAPKTLLDGQVLCGRIIAYMIQHQLGGRHNMIDDDVTDAAADDDAGRHRMCQLAVEASRPTVGALTTSATHVSRLVDGVVDPAYNAVRRERVGDQIVALRKAMHTCNPDVDIVGGWTHGGTPALRRGNLAKVLHGMRGEKEPTKRPRDGRDGDSHTNTDSHANTTSNSKLLSLLQSDDDDE